jgi:protein-tyrosine-phosphatase
MARVLFVCLHNGGRSQMSRAFFERDAGGRHESDSAVARHPSPTGDWMGTHSNVR